MKQIIASIYDSKVRVWSFPQQFVNKGALARAWEETCNDTNSPFAKYPSDFTMFIVGEWDDETGQISMHQAPEPLGTAVQFVRAPLKPVHAQSEQQQTLS